MTKDGASPDEALVAAGAAAAAVLDEAERLLVERFPELATAAGTDRIRRGSNFIGDGYVGAFFRDTAPDERHFVVLAEPPFRLPGHLSGGTAYTATIIVRRPALNAAGFETEEVELPARATLRDLVHDIASRLERFDPTIGTYVIALDPDCRAIVAIETGEWQAALAAGILPGNRISMGMGRDAAEALDGFSGESRRSPSFDSMIEAGKAMIEMNGPSPGRRGGGSSC